MSSWLHCGVVSSPVFTKPTQFVSPSTGFECNQISTDPMKRSLLTPLENALLVWLSLPFGGCYLLTKALWVSQTMGTFSATGPDEEPGVSLGLVSSAQRAEQPRWFCTKINPSAKKIYEYSISPGMASRMATAVTHWFHWQHSVISMFQESQDKNQHNKAL